MYKLVLFISMCLSVLEIRRPVEACTCLAPKVPAYCTTDFFLLAQILGKTENTDRNAVRYRFKPLEIISDPQNIVETRKMKQFHSSSASSACGVELTVGSTYLIGGMFSASNQRLRLDLCRSYVERYDRPTWVEGQFKELLQKNCDKINFIRK